MTPAKEAGITAGVPNYFENSSGCKIKYKRIPVYDASTSDLLSYADEIVQFISNGLHHGSVLVHCQRGVSRSATSVIMFLMRKANMTMNQALRLCQRRRPMADPIPAFLEQLRSYERECRSWGHLTSTDESKSDDKKITKAGPTKSVSEKKEGNVMAGPIVGEKRKTDDNDSGDGEKKRRTVVGPIGPPKGPIGPAMGPSKSASDGKSNQECKDDAKQKDASTSENKRVAGPSIGPAKKVIGPMKPQS